MNIIKLMLATIASFVGVVVSLILILPWLWNWIVTIYKSPLPATEASKIYLYESILECLPFVLGFIALVVIADILINKRWKDETDEYQFYMSPTLPVKDEKKTLNDTPKPEIVADTQSRGVDTTVTIHGENSGEFVHVMGGSKEHSRALTRKALIEKQLQEEHNEILEGANDMLRGFQTRIKQART